MAKRRRSAAQRAAFKKMIAALHRKRSGRGHKRKSGKRRARHTAKRSAHKRRRTSRRSARRTAARHIRHVTVAPHTTLKVYKRKRRARRAKKHYGKAAKTIRVNPGRRTRRRHARRNPALSVKRFGHEFMDGITHVLGNLKMAMKGGVMGYATVGAGAVGGVFAGTFLANLLIPQIIKLSPTIQAAEGAGGTMIGNHWITNPVVARLLAFGNYYLGGFLLAKFTPGLSPRTRTALLAGGTAAAIIETIRPGTIKEGIQMLPIVGDPISAKLSDYELGLADSVYSALSGGRPDDSPDGSTNPGWDHRLGAYTRGRIGVAPGVGAYIPGRGMGAYIPGRSGMGAYNAMSGSAEEALGCASVDSSGMDFDVTQ